MNRQSGERENVVFIQILRGLAPILVVFAHLPQLWLVSTGATWRGTQFYSQYILQPLQLNGGGGKLGVIIFFLISGFIMSMIAAQETRMEFLVKRILRIFPGLIAATLIGYVTVTISTRNDWGPIYSNDAVAIIDFVKSAFMISWLTQAPRALSVAWSLMPELIFYALVFILLPMLHAKPIRSTWMLTGLCGLLVSPMAAIPYFNYLGYFTVYLPIFVIGRVLYLYRASLITGQQSIGLLAMNLFLFCTFFNSRFPGDLFRDFGMIYNIGLGCIAFYALMTMGPVRCPHFLAFISKISYSLYLVHLSVGILTLNALASSALPMLLKTLLAIGASIAAAACVFYAVEQPSQRLARRLTSRLRKNSALSMAYAG